MEEILASIRRIISDEDTPAGGKAAAEPEEAMPAAGEEMSQDDLDKLFDSAGDDDIEVEIEEPVSAKVEMEAEADIDVDTDDVLELTEDQAVEADDEIDAFDMVEGLGTDEDEAGDVAFVDQEPDPAPAPKAAPRAAPRASAAPEGDDLLSPDANQAVQAAFHNLAGTILSNNARTLEDLVKEMLRPMLKGWLDENLPPLVERLVRQEIERVSRGR
ncbi:DUF2497 domain-containing protein [Stappia sp. 28M-7]|uniref:DUF2497 domain-containing protein n=1 Tax=Stappia sp. 28M-7 TaxID=2762596 RepID=UPI0027389B0C|nr:DUF2497 domain-containing protein [Stappia sp. 28M-7]